MLSEIKNANDLITRIASIGNVVIYLLISLAFIYIIWSTVQYFVKGNAGDESRHAAGMQIFWGVVGLAIIVSLWGLVNLVVYTFWTDTTRPDLPNANFVQGASNSRGADYSGSYYQPFDNDPVNFEQ